MAAKKTAPQATERVKARKVIVVKKMYDGFAVREEGTILMWKQAGELPSSLELMEEEDVPQGRSGRGSSPAAATQEDDDNDETAEVVI